MKDRMTSPPKRADTGASPLLDCSQMDSSVAERLRSAVSLSLEWAEETLNVLIRLDEGLQGFDAAMRQRMHALSLPGHPDLDLEDATRQTEEGIRCLRSQVLDVMMSMQNQDVIGQAVERAASALEKRAAVSGKSVMSSDDSRCRANEIAEIHRAYLTEDDLHRATRLDGEEYKTAA